MTILLSGDTVDESNLNNLVFNMAIQAGGGAHKIPDPPQAVAMMSAQRPFDGFGIVDGFSFYWEGKFDKAYGAMAFSRLAEHQHENLSVIKRNKGNAWVVWGVWENRKFFDVWVFDYALVEKLLGLGVKSFKKKELEILKEKKLFTNTMRGRGGTPAVFQELKDKVITEEVYDGVFGTGWRMAQTKKEKD